MNDVAAHLAKACSLGRLSAGIILAGPAGAGKHSTALKLIATSLCTGSRPTCGTCPACKAVYRQQHQNVQVLDADSIGIEMVRDRLRQFLTIRSKSEPAWLLVMQAQRLSESAGNALLKFLEEPPPQTYTVLTVPDEDQLLPTIRSRMSIYRLPLQSKQELIQQAGQSRASKSLQQQAVARALGRVEWLDQSLAQPEQLVNEADQVLGLLLGLEDPLERLASIEVEAIPSRLNLYELTIRELLLTQLGATGRLLWPQLAPEFQRIAGRWQRADLLALADRIAERHEWLRHHVQPKIIYDHLTTFA